MGSIAKKKCVTLSNLVDEDKDDFLLNIDVQSIHKDAPTQEDKWCDVNEFFHATIMKDINGKMKKYCTCKLCLYVSYIFLFYSMLIVL
jgi:hypothetical protein